MPTTAPAVALLCIGEIAEVTMARSATDGSDTLQKTTTMFKKVELLVIVIAQLTGPDPLGGLDVKAWDDSVRLLNQEHDSVGAHAKDDEEDAPKAAPIKLLSIARGGVTQSLMSTRRKEVGVNPRPTPRETGTHAQHQPHV